jgi:4-amino-4-deoxy-L-arabinose transferase-like glycosyltransferase
LHQFDAVGVKLMQRNKKGGFLARFFRQAGVLVALASALLGVIWSVGISPLHAPDEQAHLQAIIQVRKQHILPEIHYEFETNTGGAVVGNPGDQAARDYALSLGIGVGRPRLLIPYESMQPPLYYVAAGLVSQVAPPDPPVVLYLSRLVAVLFGAGAVYFCWAAVRVLAPQAAMWAVASAGAMALLPQFCFNSATAANDSALNFAATASFYVWFKGLRQPEYDSWMLRAGALLGLAVLAKLTAVALAPGLALVILFRAFQSAPSASLWRERLRRGLRMAVGAIGATLFVCGWWLLRNMLIYGEPSGSRDALRSYAEWNAKLVPDINLDLFLRLTLESLWGLFGGMSIRMPALLYDLSSYLALGLVALSGVALLSTVFKSAREGTARRAPTRILAYAWQAGLAMLAVAATLAAGYLRFNLTVGFQPQARYFFMLLLPLSMLFTGGLYALVPGRRLKALALSLPLLWLAFLNVVGLAVTWGRPWGT